jgi:hypothetical protein
MVLEVTPITEYVNNYRQNWLQHVKRRDRARIPKQVFRYAPTGGRLPGRPKKRWLETVTATKPNTGTEYDSISYCLTFRTSLEEGDFV